MIILNENGWDLSYLFGASDEETTVATEMPVNWKEGLK
jgi:hypothetical protein